MREIPGFSAGPTARLSILKPRRANRPAMRVSTPASSSTNTERVCLRVWGTVEVRGERVVLLTMATEENGNGLTTDSLFKGHLV
jgi:hypothetical protein